MSQSFAGVPLIQYDRTPNNLPVQLCERPTIPPICIPLTIDWQQYWNAAGQPATVGVKLDLTDRSSWNRPDWINTTWVAQLAAKDPQAASILQNQLIDGIRAIKIDNSNSLSPVSVVFPDTGDVITAPPNSIVTMPVVTNGFKVYIYAQNLSAGSFPLACLIFLFNVPYSPSVDPQIQTVFPQWLGSPLIQRLNQLTPGFAPPALGDQTAQITMPVTSPNTVAVLPIQASGHYYITAVQFVVIDNFVVNPPLSGYVDEVQFKGIGSGTIIHKYNWYVPQFQLADTLLPAVQIGLMGVQEIYNQSGLQIRLPATDTYAISKPAGISFAGFCQIYVTYTFNPSN